MDIRIPTPDEITAPKSYFFLGEKAARIFYWQCVALHGSTKVSLPTYNPPTDDYIVDIGDIVGWKVTLFPKSEKVVDAARQSVTMPPVGRRSVSRSLDHNRGVSKMNDTQHAQAEHDAEVAKKLAEEAHHQTVAKLMGIQPPHVRLAEHTFRFRTPRDEKGKPKVDDLGNPVKKRDDVKLMIPVPTFDGVVEALQDEKQREFILSIIEDRIDQAAKEQVSDETKPVNKQTELDVAKLSLKYLAELPPAERRGGGISSETWDLFAKDYAEIMPGITGKDAEKIGNAIKIFLGRLQPAKTNKVVLKALKEQLALWFSKSENAQELSEVYEFLTEKADTFLALDEKELLANL